jgi:hypothetical protein
MNSLTHESLCKYLFFSEILKLTNSIIISKKLWFNFINFTFFIKEKFDLNCGDLQTGKSYLRRAQRRKKFALCSSRTCVVFKGCPGPPYILLRWTGTEVDHRGGTNAMPRTESHARGDAEQNELGLARYFIRASLASHNNCCWAGPTEDATTISF